MQSVELHAGRVLGWNRVNFANRCSQRIHSGDDPELRYQGERKHQVDKNVASGEHMRRALTEAAIENRTHQENDAGEDAHPVQCAQGTPNHCSREMPRGQYGKGRRRQNEGEEDQAAQPDDQS